VNGWRAGGRFSTIGTRGVRLAVDGLRIRVQALGNDDGRHR
jgi:hypothetical protein